MMWSCVWAFVTGMLVGIGASGLAAEPLENAHAHNDYWQKRPLLDALDLRFASVEADVFLADGILLVGHAIDELDPERTLERLYLAPLAQRARAHHGRIDPSGTRFFLLIDIKCDPQAAHKSLHQLLSQYADMLTVVDHGRVRPGAVTVVLSGNRPWKEIADAPVRYAGLDGRISDLDREAPAHLVPMISDSWPAHFTWRGDGPMPEREQHALRAIVAKAHARGRVVRFWATPEKEVVWQELLVAGVDLIGTDQLDRLATFLRSGPIGRTGEAAEARDVPPKKSR